jgi:rare lipoprotein A
MVRSAQIGPRGAVRTLLFLGILALLLASCGPKRPRVQTPVQPRIGTKQNGLASWYGHPYHGRRAANGEVYDMEQLTAAHRTWAFDTWVRVHNLDNGQRVDVRITDRGPFVKGRIIDLSRAAAREIDMIGPGVVKVRLQVIKPPKTARTAQVAPPPPAPRQPPPAAPEPVQSPATSAAGGYAVQVGVFRNYANADRLRRDLERNYGIARLVEREGSAPMWRVLVGECQSEEEAEELAVRLRAGAALSDSFVVRLD